MNTIGKKIKELRMSKRFTQENLIPDNPSQVSQIESGKIKNPTEPTLNMIAKVLEIDFQELVEGTNWEPGNSKAINKGYAYSKTEVIVRLEESGEILTKMKSYPRFNEEGEENIYCPDTGTKLLICCKKCSRSIDNSNISYCMGCGTLLGKYGIPSYTIKNLDFISNIDSINKECKILEEQIETCNRWIMHFYNWLPFDEITDGYIPDGGYDQDFLQDFVEHSGGDEKWVEWMLDELDQNNFNWITFREKHKSSNKTISETWCHHYLELSYYRGIIKELKRYGMAIVHEDSHNIASKDDVLKRQDEETQQEMKDLKLDKEPEVVNKIVSSTQNGDDQFLEELPEHLMSIGVGLLIGVRKQYNGDLKYFPKSGKYVEKPDNFWTVKIQPRDKSLRVTVRGLPSNFPHVKYLDIKNDMGGYSAFKVKDEKQLKEAIDVILRAKR